MMYLYDISSVDVDIISCHVVMFFLCCCSCRRQTQCVNQCFSTFSLKRNLWQQFWLFRVPRAMIHVLVLLHKAKRARPW